MLPSSYSEYSAADLLCSCGLALAVCCFGVQHFKECMSVCVCVGGGGAMVCADLLSTVTHICLLFLYLLGGKDS